MQGQKIMEIRFLKQVAVAAADIAETKIQNHSTPPRSQIKHLAKKILCAAFSLFPVQKRTVLFYVHEKKGLSWTVKQIGGVFDVS